LAGTSLFGEAIHRQASVPVSFQEQSMTLQSWLCIWLLITLTIVGAYDIYAVLFLGGNSTVSFEIYQLGKRFPTFFLFLGILVGHIILPLHVHDDMPPFGKNNP
jgi:hypothetical protein